MENYYDDQYYYDEDHKTIFGYDYTDMYEDEVGDEYYLVPDISDDFLHVDELKMMIDHMNAAYIMARRIEELHGGLDWSDAND